jgi:hypothetical protein
VKSVSYEDAPIRIDVAHGAEKGLSEAGQTIVLPLLVARECHAFRFVFNGELEKPLHDSSPELAS